MLGSVGKYRKPNGVEEVRMHFAEWLLEDGRVLKNVTVHPHLCGTCAGGDHTHVEINDMRQPESVLGDRCVNLSEAHLEALNRLLVEKVAVDSLTRELATYIAAGT